MRGPATILLAALLFAIGLLLWGVNSDHEFVRGLGVLLTLFCAFAFPTVAQNTRTVHSQHAALRNAEGLDGQRTTAGIAVNERREEP